MTKIKNSRVGKTSAWYAPGQSYAIWLVPEGRVRLHLRKQIAALSKKYGTPDFDPHVTLVGLGAIPPQSGAELEDRLARLAKALHPFTIRLREVVHSDAFFRSIVIAIEPTSEVMKAGNLGRTLYKEIHKKEPSDPEYFPHLSLLYSNMTAEQREPIISTELAGLEIRKDQEKLYISFEVSTLELHDCSTQDTRNWRLLKEFALAKPAAQRTLEKTI